MTVLKRGSIVLVLAILAAFITTFVPTQRALAAQPSAKPSVAAASFSCFTDASDPIKSGTSIVGKGLFTCNANQVYEGDLQITIQRAEWYGWVNISSQWVKRNNVKNFTAQIAAACTPGYLYRVFTQGYFYETSSQMFGTFASSDYSLEKRPCG